jgi:hypothetical protein
MNARRSPVSLVVTTPSVRDDNVVGWIENRFYREAPRKPSRPQMLGHRITVAAEYHRGLWVPTEAGTRYGVARKGESFGGALGSRQTDPSFDAATWADAQAEAHRRNLEGC